MQLEELQKIISIYITFLTVQTLRYSAIINSVSVHLSKIFYYCVHVLQYHSAQMLKVMTGHLIFLSWGPGKTEIFLISDIAFFGGVRLREDWKEDKECKNIIHSFKNRKTSITTGSYTTSHCTLYAESKEVGTWLQNQSQPPQPPFLSEGWRVKDEETNNLNSKLIISTSSRGAGPWSPLGFG